MSPDAPPVGGTKVGAASRVGLGARVGAAARTPCTSACVGRCEHAFGHELLLLDNTWNSEQSVKQGAWSSFASKQEQGKTYLGGAECIGAEYTLGSAAGC